MVNSIGGSTTPPTSTLNRLVDASTNATHKLEKIQTAVATGQKSDSYGSLGDMSGQYSSAESGEARAISTQYQALLTQPILKASASLAHTLSEFADQGSKIATQTQNGDIPDFDVTQQAKNYLDQVLDLMNTKVGNLSITSGSVSDKKAWDKTALQDPDTYALNDTDDKSLPDGYQGDDHRLSFKLDGITYEVTLSGNELAPQRLVRAFQLLSTPKPDDSATDVVKNTYAAKIDESARLFRLAQTGMNAIEARLGIVDQQVENAKKTAARAEFDFTNTKEKINGVNTTEMIPQMSVLAVYINTIMAMISKDTELTREATRTLLAS